MRTIAERLFIIVIYLLEERFFHMYNKNSLFLFQDEFYTGTPLQLLVLMMDLVLSYLLHNHILN